MSEPLFNEVTGWRAETLSKIDPATDVPELFNEYLFNANGSFRKHVDESIQIMFDLHK